MTAVIDEYFEQQYNNRAAVVDHPRYLQSWKSRSEYYKNNNQGFLNLAYGTTARQVLDIFPVDTRRKSPVHIFIHGGYWQALDKNSFSFMAETFNRHGECAVILGYDLCPTVSIAEIVEQMKQAVLWIVNNIQSYGGDSQQIQISGHSAGAHLLAMLLTTDWSEFGLDTYPFQRLNGISGLYDLQPLIQTSVNRGLGLDRTTALQLSPLYGDIWKPEKKLQLNLLVGELESKEYKMQSSRLAVSWQDHLTIEYHEIPDAHHFSIVDKFLTLYQQDM